MMEFHTQSLVTRSYKAMTFTGFPNLGKRVGTIVRCRLAVVTNGEILSQVLTTFEEKQAKKPTALQSHCSAAQVEKSLARAQVVAVCGLTLIRPAHISYFNIS